LHATPISKLMRRDIAPYLSGPPVAAARARSRLMSCCKWAMEMGLLDVNPVIGSGVPDRHIKPRERVLSLDEIAAIWKACDGPYAYDVIVKLLIVTAMRRAEVGDLRWRELDRANGLCVIPASKAKSGRDFTLPLPPLAWSIIDDGGRRGAGADWLFSSHGFQAWSQCKKALDARCGVEAWTHHDLRRSAATALADAGTPPHVVEAILGHQYGSRVARTYNRARHVNEMKTALAMWADRIRSQVEGGERKVVPLRS
jgi:integrase